MSGRACMVALSWVAGCGSPAPAAPAPAPAVPAPAAEAPATPKAATMNEAGETVEGTIDAIVLQNINKARGHYTYNVELVVARPDADPIHVRVDKVYFGRLTPARQAELAPNGPAQTLRPARYDEWSVGDTVALPVEITSPGLALLRR